ncbi:MAG: hypothetical protein U0350_32815 [Caldilineaceae bacterium]
MAQIGEQREFESWVKALKEHKLTPEQIALLQEMVDKGKASDLARAAQLLDWHESVVNPTEHLYGF